MEGVGRMSRETTCCMQVGMASYLMLSMYYDIGLVGVPYHHRT